MAVRIEAGLQIAAKAVVEWIALVDSSRIAISSQTVVTIIAAIGIAIATAFVVARQRRRLAVVVPLLKENHPSFARNFDQNSSFLPTQLQDQLVSLRLEECLAE